MKPCFSNIRPFFAPMKQLVECFILSWRHSRGHCFCYFMVLVAGLISSSPLFSQEQNVHGQSSHKQNSDEQKRLYSSSYGSFYGSAGQSVEQSSWQSSRDGSAVGEKPFRLIQAGVRQSNGFTSLARVVPEMPYNAHGYNTQERRASNQEVARSSGSIYLKTKQRIITDKGDIADASIRRCLNVHAQLRVREVTVLPDGFLTAVYGVKEEGAERLCEQLSVCAGVEYAEQGQTLQPHQSSFPTPNDPLFSRQYHLQRIRAQEAWALTQGDSALVIAVCDTGVDWEHEDLAKNIWVNPGESGLDTQGRDKRTNGMDDDRNGKIDDWHGWDFVGAADEADLRSGRYREDNDPKPRFPNGLVPQELPNHGTIVAGIVAAEVNNARGGVGAAPRCKILPIKCSTDGVRLDGIYRPYEAVLYAAQMGAKVIVCSFGGGRYSRAEEDIVRAVAAQGVLIVAAAGNTARLTDNIEYPASYNGVLAVGSSNAGDRASASSDFGVMIDVFAPGEQILSTATGSEYTESFSGTSMAVPLVAAAAALVKSRFPEWSPMQIRQQLRASSDNVLLGTGSALNRPFGYFGRLNMHQALTATFPGLTVQNMSIDAATGVIQDVQPVALRFTLKNHLAIARNVALTLRSLDGRASVLEGVQQLGTLQAGAEQTVNLTMQLDPSALAGTGLRTADFVVVMLADGYVNYQRIAVPYNIRPSQSAQMLVSPVLDFSLVANPVAQNTLQAVVVNSGSTALNITSLRLSGANSSDFQLQIQVPVNVNSGASVAVPVRFAPQVGRSGERSAQLTMTAQPQGVPMLGAIAGGYDFTAVQAEYREFTDGTPLFGGAGALDDAQITFGIGFPFRYGAEQYESITISSNGFCAFAPAESLVQQSAVVTRPLSTFVGAKGYIAVVASDMIFPTTTISSGLQGDVRFKTEGLSPNRVFAVQWRNAVLKSAPDVRINAQLRLYETSGRVEMSFGDFSLPATRGTVSVETGLRGNSSADIHARRVSEDIRSTWFGSAEAHSNEDACEFSARALPPRGLLYRWSPLASPRQIVLQPIERSILLRGLVANPTSVEDETNVVTNAMANAVALRTFPNPVQHEVFCDIPPLRGNAVLSVVNMRGEIMWQEQIQQMSSVQQIRLETRDWAQGIYILRIRSPYQTLQQRFVVLR